MRRLLILAIIAIVVAGCAVAPVQERPPVPVGPVGRIVPGEAGGPPVECRGVPIEQCRSFGSGDDRDVVRYIVTCTSTCTPEKGDVRIDVFLANGTTGFVGEGNYASAGAPPAVPAAPPT